jgi:hypothetical protein
MKGGFGLRGGSARPPSRTPSIAACISFARLRPRLAIVRLDPLPVGASPHAIALTPVVLVTNRPASNALALAGALSGGGATDEAGALRIIAGRVRGARGTRFGAPAMGLTSLGRGVRIRACPTAIFPKGKKVFPKKNQVPEIRDGRP